MKSTVCLVPSGAVSGTALAQAGGAHILFHVAHHLFGPQKLIHQMKAGEAAAAGLASLVARCLCQHS